MSDHNNDHPAMANGDPAAVSATLRRELRRELRDRVVEHISTSVAIFDGEVQEALFKAAAGNAATVFQNRCLESINLLRRNATVFSEDLVSAIDRRIVAVFTRRQPPCDAGTESDAANEELSVVSTEVFEEQLRRERLVKRVQGSCTPALAHLARRCAVLIGAELTPTSLPFGPAWIARTFSESATIQRLPESARSTVYDAFEQVLLRRYPDLVAALNALLGHSGVLPDLENTPLSPVRATKPGDYGADRNRNRAQAEQSVSTDAGQLYRSILSLLQLGANGPGSGSGGPGDSGDGDTGASPQFYSRDQVIDALEQLSGAPEQPGGDQRLQLLVAQTLQARHGGPARDVGRDTLQHIELVERVFKSIIERGDVCPEAQPLLRELEIPVLKISLGDPTFFSDATNPARRSIDLLARLCRPAHFHNRVIHSQIEQTIKQFCASVDQYPDAFSDIAATLDATVQRHQHAQQHNVRRLALTLSGRERLERTRRAVDEDLFRRYGDTQIATTILELLDSGWREVLVQRALRHGSDSPEWYAALEPIEQLQQWLTPASPPQEPPSQQALAAALHAIEVGLDEFAIDPTAAVRATHQLERLFAGEETAAYADGYPPPLAESDTSQSLRRWEERSRELRIGDWLASYDGSEQLLHLAWIDEHRNRFVFVNEQGHQIHDWSRQQLAEQLHAGLAPIDEPDRISAIDDSLFETVHDVFAELSRKHNCDSLTGLLNRQAFEQQVCDYSRRESGFTLLGCNIDRFRLINQYHDHRAGDELLKTIGELLNATTGDGASLARLDSDTFSALLAIDDAAGPADELAERWRAAIEALRFQWDGQVQEITASVGVVAFDGAAAETVDAFKLLDSAIGRAKAGGGNQVHFRREGSADAAAPVDPMLAWVTNLGSILENNRLRLRCQRIWPLGSSDSDDTHHELLLGVLDANGAIHSPVDLIAAAERYQRMDTIDRWVVRSFLQWCRRHPDAFDQLGVVSINLSGNSIGNDRFLAFLRNELERTDVALDRICFEITETATIANLADAADFIRSIKRYGCRFALDDFGTGLSSFEYLKRLPVDYLKIDGVFVRDIEHSETDLAMVRAINQIAHILGKASIAECVESKTALELVRDIGVDFAQGWTVGRPFVLDDVS